MKSFQATHNRNVAVNFVYALHTALLHRIFIDNIAAYLRKRVCGYKILIVMRELRQILCI